MVKAARGLLAGGGWLENCEMGHQIAPRFLVTAGSTREAIDRVRDWGNIFTGNTGYGIARALSRVGTVDLLTSNPVHLAETSDSRGPIRGIAFKSHADLRDRLESLMMTQQYDGIFMTAAVSDYTPVGAFQVVSAETRADGSQMWIVRDAQAGKVKSHFDSIAVLGQRTEKLVDLFRSRWKFSKLLVKFKLEVGISEEQLVHIGQASRAASGADYLVANTLEMVSGPRAGCFVLGEGKSEWVSREELPARMASLARAFVPR